VGSRVDVGEGGGGAGVQVGVAVMKDVAVLIVCGVIVAGAAVLCVWDSVADAATDVGVRSSGAVAVAGTGGVAGDPWSHAERASRVTKTARPKTSGLKCRR
jgi:hypothetical protein